MMNRANVAGIFVAAKSGQPLSPVAAARAVPGRGIEGDRYFEKSESVPNKIPGEREITLIENEALEALQRDYHIELLQHETRRNVVTQGVALNHLVGREFTVGQVRLRGLRLCEPCGHLEK